jgi:hypothetical protein
MESSLLRTSVEMLENIPDPDLTWLWPFGLMLACIAACVVLWKRNAYSVIPWWASVIATILLVILAVWAFVTTVQTFFDSLTAIWRR